MNVQIIKENNKPAFAVISYSEFEQIQRKLALFDELESIVTFPLEVVKMRFLKGYGMIEAWRIYQGKTLEEMAEALKISQDEFSQIEKSEFIDDEALGKIANALNLTQEQSRELKAFNTPF
jgi:DNA-directed RNA polymerase sigma subunit (sigma70/sigma32)